MTITKSERRRLKRADGRWVETDKPGCPGDHGFISIRQVPPGSVVGRWLRVSAREQRRNNNLNNQQRRLDNALGMTRRGLTEVKVPGFAGHVGSGYGPEYLAALRSHCLKLKRRGATHVAATNVNRFLRPDDYRDFNPDAQPTDRELRAFVAALCGLVPVTVLKPDASPARERGYSTRMGQRAKGSKGGGQRTRRPGYKKDRRDQLLEKVLRLRRQGRSFRDIGAMTGVPYRTVADWCAEYAPKLKAGTRTIRQESKSKSQIGATATSRNGR